MRFLLSRRWLLFALTVVVLAYACLWLGRWQFHRLHDREQRNAYTRHNLVMTPVPVDQLMSTDHGVSEAHEWSRVEVRGTYDPSQTIVVRYQTRDGQAGVDIVTPVKLPDGDGVLVDRGWVQTDNVGTALNSAPPPQSGPVTVVGWARTDATGSSTSVADHSVRSISSRAIGKVVPYRLLQGFVDAEQETPTPAHPLVPVDKPDLGNGPHFFYGLQWWFFGCLAVFGFGYLAYDERRKLKAGDGPQPARADDPDRPADSDVDQTPAHR